MKLAFKIAGTLVLVVIIALALASYMIGRTTDRTYRTYLDDAQRGQLEWLAGQVEIFRAAGEDWAVIQNWLSEMTRAPATNAAAPNLRMPGMQGMRGSMHQQRSRNEDSSGTPIDDPAVLLVDLAGQPIAVGGQPVSQELLNIGIPVVENGETVAYVVPSQAGPRIGQAEATLLANVQRAILLSAGAGALIALVLGALLVWTLLRPLRNMHEAVSAITHGDLGARVTELGNDELGDLGSAFNDMAARLETQEQLRRRLMADVAHELRTPLSVIQGNLQAILDGIFPLTPDEVEKVYRESNLLSRLIDDLHELAQAEAGALSLQLQSIDAVVALRKMQNLLEPMAATRDLTLRLELPSSPVTLIADPDRLQQILYNLIGNALRHTPPGGTVIIGTQLRDHDFLRFTVRDTGPGIDAEHLPHIFDRFYRADRSRRRDGDPTAGAGLGLAIVRALVEAHGGRVGVTSNQGEGATFWVDLPLTPEQVQIPA